jgi:hypothetical protein
MTGKVTVSAHRRGFDPPQSPFPNRMLKKSASERRLLIAVYDLSRLFGSTRPTR